ncbi:hypothetical protein PGQ11_008227 [Apiospora arundinis]|uniref:Pentatricopeptide repeat domain-containing protein n=1 Tax=Apiospora arundinis TaxID=335852 RepID=A0ABR2IEH2_9PEZI
MHALWSRAAQAQSSCRCRGCLHTATTITRRSTTAASRRRVTAADIFTACYTTILGTAAVVDAHRKEARKKDLDEKLDRARAALSTLAIQEPPSRDEAPSRESSSNCPGSPETPIEASEGEAGSSSTSTASLLEELARLAADTYQSSTRSWLQHQVDWAAIEAAISAEEQDQDIEIRHPSTQVQLEKTTNAIETLVRQLVFRCRVPKDQTAAQSTQLAEGQKKERILEKVEKLRNGPHYPSYDNPRSDPEGAAEARALLNDSFRRIFNQVADVKEVVGKICHNLLVSRAPPNIHNYNALIAGFNRIQRPDLAQAVVDSYFADTKWPATQQTIVCLLNHAVATNDIEQFRHVVRRMRGVAEDGLHFRIINKKAIFNPHGLLWAEANCASRKHAWVERAKRGNCVFDNLIQGWLHFGKVGTASMSFVACLREGCFVSVDTIKELLSQCLSHLDQQSARRLLKGLAKNFEHFEVLMKTISSTSPPPMARSIAVMFYSLFDLSGLPYTPVVGGVTKSLRTVLLKFRSLYIVTKAKIELEEIGNASREVLRSLGTGKHYSVRVSSALALLGEKPQGIMTEAMPAKDVGLIPGLAALLKRFQALEEKTLRIEAHAKVSVIYALSGVHLDPRSYLPPVEWQNRRRNERYPAVFHALQSINLKDVSPGRNNLRRQLLLGLPDQKLAKQLIDLACWQNIEFGTLMSLYQGGPNTSKRLRIRQEEGSPRIAEVKRRLEDAEDATRALLFSFLKWRAQRDFRRVYPNWYDMPIAKLYEYHHQNINCLGTSLVELKASSSGRRVSAVERGADGGAEVAAVSSPEGTSALAPTPEQLPLASGDLAMHNPAVLSLHTARPVPVLTLSEQQIQSREQLRFQAAAAMA